ncbi:hypothetical protein VTO73DRAFT_7459 [Trametes versicolor]
MRRDQDVINPRTHADIMMLAEDHAPHRFLYGRVIDIFHARVSYTGPGATREMRRFHRMDFLRVRWFEIDEDYDAGFQERRLPRLRFVDYERSEDAAFGFVDPNLVLRAAFIVPAFDLGISLDLLPPSTLARRASDNDEDYAFYYSCIFADRDMYMRYLGGGVGHRENGVDLETSKKHAVRWKRAGGYTFEPGSDTSAASAEGDGGSSQDAPDENTPDLARPRKDTARGARTRHRRTGRNGPTQDNGHSQTDEEGGGDEHGEGEGDEDDEDEDNQLEGDEDDEDEDEDDQGEYDEEYYEEAEYEGEAFAGEHELEELEVQGEWDEDEDYYLDQVFGAEGFAPL